MIWIAAALVLVALARAAYVAATYVIFAYESAQRGFPHFEQSGPGWIIALRAIAGMVFEIVSSLLVLLFYPVRILMRDRGPVRAGPTGAGDLRRGATKAPRGNAGSPPCRPVLLVHGMYVNGGALLLLRRRLRRAGFLSVHLLDLDFRRGHISTLSDQVIERVEEIRAATGADRVDAVGHSLGAVVVFHTLVRGGGDRLFGTCVALGAPFHGTGMASFSRSPLVRQLRPGSPVLADLRAKIDAPGALPPGARLVSIWSNFDNVIIPAESQILPGPDAENVRVEFLGHVSLLFSRAVANQVARVLSGSI